MMTHQNEATLFGNYLIHRKPTPEVIARYEKFLVSNIIPITQHDKKILAFASLHPWSIPLLDNALSLLKPDAELRRRIYTMLTVLETTPEHADKFLPVKRSPLYVVPLVFWGIIATIQLLAGIVLLKLVVR